MTDLEIKNNTVLGNLARFQRHYPDIGERAYNSNVKISEREIEEKHLQFN